MTLAELWAAFKAIPQIVDLLSQMVGKIDALVVAQENAKDQEIRAAQNALASQIQGVTNDQQRAALAAQLSALEQRIIHK